CAACDQGEFAADRLLGISGYVTKGACRMACLLGVHQSFEKAQLALLEVAGLSLDDNTIRRLCHATAKDASATREERATADLCATAPADAVRPVASELHVDAGKVNTLGGWRDVKVAVFAQRERGEPATV